MRLLRQVGKLLMRLRMTQTSVAGAALLFGISSVLYEIHREQYLQHGQYHNALSLFGSSLLRNMGLMILLLQVPWFYQRKLERLTIGNLPPLPLAFTIAGLQFAGLYLLYELLLDKFYTFVTPLAAVMHGFSSDDALLLARQRLEVMLGPRFFNLDALAGDMRVPPLIIVVVLLIPGILVFMAFWHVAILISRRLNKTLNPPRPLRPAGRQLLYVATVLGLGVALHILPGLVRPKNPASQPNIVVISIDTLRHDHTTIGFDYERQTTPAMRELATNSTVFTRAYSQSTWTLPSHATMLTGLQPSQHSCDAIEGNRLPPQARTIVEYLRETGYLTYLIASTYFLTSAYGLDQGFSQAQFSRANAFELVARAMEGLASDDLSQPFFLFLHLFDPHEPYTPDTFVNSAWASPEDLTRSANGEVTPWLQKFGVLAPDSTTAQSLINLYDAEIRRTDEAIGLLLQYLKAIPSPRETAIIITADHGEAFGENGDYTHGQSVEPAMTRVPLLVHAPSHYPTGEITMPVAANLQVAAAIAHIAGLPVDNSWPLAITQDSNQPPAMVISDTRLHYNPRIAVVDDKNYVEFELVNGSMQFLHAYADLPDGRVLAQPITSETLKNYYAAGLAYINLPRAYDTAASPKVRLSPSDRELLRSLHYLQ